MDSESFVADVKRKILASNAWAFELRKIRMENEDLKVLVFS